MGRRANPSDSPLRQMRQELGWSLTKLAERIGYSKGYLSMVESGVKRPTRQLIEAYESSLRLPAGALSATIAGREKWEFGSGMLEDQPSDESEYDQLTKLSANPSQARLVIGAWAVSALALELITAASDKPPSGKGEILNKLPERKACRLFDQMALVVRVTTESVGPRMERSALEVTGQ